MVRIGGWWARSGWEDRHDKWIVSGFIVDGRGRRSMKLGRIASSAKQKQDTYRLLDTDITVTM